MIFVVALAGSLARQKPIPGIGGHAAHPPSAVHADAVGVILIVVGLTYFPALALGPIAEGLS